MLSKLCATRNLQLQNCSYKKFKTLIVRLFIYSNIFTSPNHMIVLFCFTLPFPTHPYTVLLYILRTAVLVRSEYMNTTSFHTLYIHTFHTLFELKLH